MEGFENIPLPKLPGTEFYNPLDLARPRPQVFKVVNGIAGNYGEVRGSFSPLHLFFRCVCVFEAGEEGNERTHAKARSFRSFAPAVLPSPGLSATVRPRAQEALGGEDRQQEGHAARLARLRWTGKEGSEGSSPPQSVTPDTPPLGARALPFLWFLSRARRQNRRS